MSALSATWQLLIYAVVTGMISYVTLQNTVEFWKAIWCNVCVHSCPGNGSIPSAEEDWALLYTSPLSGYIDQPAIAPFAQFVPNETEANS